MPHYLLSTGECVTGRDLGESDWMENRQPAAKLDEPRAEQDENLLQHVRAAVEAAEQIRSSMEHPLAPLRESRAAIGLDLASLLLPRAARRDWREEQRRYLADLDTRRGELAWVLGQLIGMPRYAYTVRTAPGTSESIFAPLDFAGELICEWTAELVALRTRRRRAAFLTGITLALSRIDLARRSGGRGRRAYLIGLVLCLPRFLPVLRAIRLVRRRPL